MKVAYASDLHLEFFLERFHKTRLGITPIPRFPRLDNTENAEVLILAGDIGNIKQFLSGSYDDFFDHISEQYKEIIWVFGNHEYYGTTLSNDTTLQVGCALEDMGYTNIYATNRGFFHYGGVDFLCGTLWTDYDKCNPVAMIQASVGMSDCKVIFQQNDEPLSKYKKRVYPEFIYDNEHLPTLKGFEDHLSFLVEKNSSTPVVVVSHHAPSYKSIGAKFSGSSLNPAFASDLEYMFAIYPHLKYWVHGHMHDEFDYKIGDSRVLCNPHGYIEYERKDYEYKVKYFEL